MSFTFKCPKMHEMSFWHVKLFLSLSLCFDIIITIYFWNVNPFHAMIGLDVSPMNDVPPHNPEYCPSFHAATRAITQSLQVFLPLSTHLPCHDRITIQADIQSSTPQCTKCPNHIILSRLTTSGTLSTPIESTLRLLSSTDTPQIHLTIYLFIYLFVCQT